MKKREKAVREPLFHIVKRSDISLQKAMLIRVIAILAALLVSGVLVLVLAGINPLKFYLSMLNGVGVTYFNKELANRYNIGDIYQTVRDGKWTLDRFAEYCKGITQDLNGDTVLNGDDMFGLTCNAFVWQPLFSGTCEEIIKKNTKVILALD